VIKSYFYFKKRIYILNSISSELAYKQEIYGIKPIFLEGNLDIKPLIIV